MNPKKTSDQIDELVLSFLRGNISTEEVIELKNWLNLDQANKDYFRELYMLWKASAVSIQNEEDVNKVFQKLNIKINKKESPAFMKKERQLHFSLSKFAAVLLLSLITGASLSFLFLKNRSYSKETIALNEINVPLGSKSRIVLPDHTEVWLNAGSKLSYSMGYGKKLREVTLEGEGYFKVAKMPEKPFIVHTSKANIKALGTEFNVKAYPDENIIETILVKGSVVVHKINSQEESNNLKSERNIVLKPGQKILIFKKNIPTNNEFVAGKSKPIQSSKKIISKQPSSKAELSPQASDTEIETSWKDPNWVIQGENVKDLFVKLGRRFNVSITLLDKDLEKYKFSGILQNETLEQVFDLMSFTIPMSYTIEKGNVEISLSHKLENKYKRAYKN
jgi:ferric-dicitrate binding protein FerR (iron transport regulator)